MHGDWGTVVLVVGPSGAGKDSIIRLAQERLADHPDFVFPRRIVTRDVLAHAEDHDTITDIAFASAVAEGRYAVWWQAHGNAYGIPVSIDDDLRIGRTVIFNCSRTVIEEVLSRYPHVVVADIKVRPDLLVERIVERGRESREEAAKRVTRTVPDFPPQAIVVPIHNDSALEDAVAEFCQLLSRLQRNALNTVRDDNDTTTATV